MLLQVDTSRVHLKNNEQQEGKNHLKLVKHVDNKLFVMCMKIHGYCLVLFKTVIGICKITYPCSQGYPICYRSK